MKTVGGRSNVCLRRRRRRRHWIRKHNFFYFQTSGRYRTKVGAHTSTARRRRVYGIIIIFHLKLKSSRNVERRWPPPHSTREDNMTYFRPRSLISSGDFWPRVTCIVFSVQGSSKCVRDSTRSRVKGWGRGVEKGKKTSKDRHFRIVESSVRMIKRKNASWKQILLSGVWALEKKRSVLALPLTDVTLS